jgi:hypothetical protein
MTGYHSLSHFVGSLNLAKVQSSLQINNTLPCTLRYIEIHVTQRKEL